ncbi:MAG TPA: response regulator [Vicinamibacterales bacterium]|nr:response regulator [Vicinamibacterales bacterium]
MSANPLILIVDDDVDTREMYAWCFEGHGFRVALAASVDQAIAQAAVETPDALVTDYTLPGGDGFGLAETLRRAESGARATMILVSGRDFTGEPRDRALRLFDRILLKPVLPDQLLDELLPMLDRRAADSAATQGL